MRPLRLALALALAGLLSLPAFAATKEELGKELLETSGVKTQVNQIPDLLDDSIAQQRRQGKLTLQQLDVLARAMRARFSTSGMYPVVEATFLESIDQKSVEEVHHWHQTPFAKKVIAMENKASTLAAQSAMQEYAQSLQSAPAPARRVKLVQGVDRAVRATDTLVEITVGITQGIASGVMRIGSVKPTKGPTNKQLNDLRAQLRSVYQGTTEIALLYTYRDLSDQELAEYLAFLSTPPAKAFSRAVARGFEAAFRDAATKMGDDIAQELGPKR